ncbi:MAG: DUF3048 domain-containing protein [Patescibacteria group bacterium]
MSKNKPAQSKKTVIVKVAKRGATSKKPFKKIKVPIVTKDRASKVKIVRPQQVAARLSTISFLEYSAWFAGLLVIVLLIGTVVVLKKEGGSSQFGTVALNSNLQLLPPDEEEQQKYVSALTGEAVTQEVIERRPLAVVIENFPSVRPQSGLSFADLVWEAPTEGGVTRFLAIFQKGLPLRIGPVRSARSYFTDWAREVRAFYAHSGGSTEALSELARGVTGLQDANEFAQENAFWREEKESRPHNLYTSAERFYDYAKGHGWNTIASLESWPYTVSDSPSVNSIATATEVIIPYFPLEYDVMWKYQEAAGVYTRLMDGKDHLDRTTGGVLQAKNVITMFTTITPLPDDPLLKVNIQTVGEGTAYLFTEGKVYKGSWQRKSLNSSTIFINNQKQPLPLQPGNSWISVLDSSLESELEYK